MNRYVVAISKNYLAYEDGIIPSSATRKQIRQLKRELRKCIWGDHGYVWLYTKAIVADEATRLRYLLKHKQATLRLLGGVQC